MTKSEAMLVVIRVVRAYLDRMPTWVANEIRAAILEWEEAKDG